MRLDKYLCDCALGSRKEVKALLKSGLVCVGRKVVTDGSYSVNPASDEVMYAGKKLLWSEFVYLMMNKPAGVVSATEDRSYPVIVDIVDEKYSRFSLFPVGRLDIDTTGLVILTNDGKTAHRLTSPRHHAEKVYYAELDGKATKEDIALFREGITIDGGYKCRSAELRILCDKGNKIELTITEGKFHQVKRMFEAVGKKVLKLKRVSMANLSLDESLAPGAYRPLTREEIELLLSV